MIDRNELERDPLGNGVHPDLRGGRPDAGERKKEHAVYLMLGGPQMSVGIIKPTCWLALAVDCRLYILAGVDWGMQ